MTGAGTKAGAEPGGGLAVFEPLGWAPTPSGALPAGLPLNPGNNMPAATTRTELPTSEARISLIDVALPCDGRWTLSHAQRGVYPRDQCS
jgi:hypothetical protein